LVKEANDFLAYIIGPSGAGKTTLAKKRYPGLNIIHTDDYETKTKYTYAIDWDSIQNRLKTSKVPSIIEGLAWHPELFRAAKHRVIVDPGLEEAIKRRALREAEKGVENDPTKVAKKIYEKVWLKDYLPKIKKLRLPYEKVV